MEHLKINFRDPKVDRLLEIVATADKLGISLPYHIDNCPYSYMDALPKLNVAGPLLYYPDKHPRGNFLYVEYTEDFNRMFEKPEDLEAIKDRVDKVKEHDAVSLSFEAKGILEKWVNGYKPNIDQVQLAITTACVINCMERFAVNVHSDSMAEATSYIVCNGRNK